MLDPIPFNTQAAMAHIPSRGKAGAERHMTTILYTHPACLEHDPGRGHPERPARLEAVLAALDTEAFAARSATS